MIDALPPLLKAVALLNITLMSVTAPVFQAPMFWLKEVANSNILLMLVTELVFQEPIGWLKAVALLNMKFMFVTAPVFQLLIDELPPLLKDVASLNMILMPLTALVFQAPIFWLKAEAPTNIKFILATAEVFQELIFAGPFKVEQPSNIAWVLMHEVKTGTSVAVIFKLLQP